MNKYFLPYDVYERHKQVGQFINKKDNVLDVGGELKHLSQFCEPKKIIVANLNTGDVLIKKGKLPFKKDSFEVVTAIDVLEHIPKSKRAEFIASLLNVASKKVILSFPIGSRKHIEYEKELLKNLTKKNRKVKYLEEHVRFGLPTHDEVLNLTKNMKIRLFFSGNHGVNKVLFNIFIFDPKIMGLRKAVFLAKKLFNAFSNEILFKILSEKTFSQEANRAYLIIEKT